MRETSALLLAAGSGTRLHPLTKHWPKCLMPIAGRPLLEYWLSILHKTDVNKVLVNLHYHAEHVIEFIKRPQLSEWVDTVYEKELLGTAGTLRQNIGILGNQTILLIHADNLCCCDFRNFIDFHHNKRPAGTIMTMMTFASGTPSACGIVEIDEEGIVRDFHEKVSDPPGNLANAAIYLLEPNVMKWIKSHPEANDFSTEVLPHFYGKIATWENSQILRDIGTVEMLKSAQNDNCEKPHWVEDDWSIAFMNNPIHQQLINS